MPTRQPSWCSSPGPLPAAGVGACFTGVLTDAHKVLRVPPECSVSDGRLRDEVMVCFFSNHLIPGGSSSHRRLNRWMAGWRQLTRSWSRVKLSPRSVNCVAVPRSAPVHMSGSSVKKNRRLRESISDRPHEIDADGSVFYTVHGPDNLLAGWAQFKS